MKRLQRKRTKTFVRPMSYTGLNPREERQQPRSAMRPVATSSETTIPEQPEQQNGLQGMLAMKEGWDQGQKVKRGVLDGTYEDKWDRFTGNVGDKYNQVTTGLSDFMTGNNTLMSMDQLPAQGMDLYGGTTGARWDMAGNTAQPMNAGVSGFQVQSSPMFEAGNMMPAGSEVMGSAHNFGMPLDQAMYEGSTMIGGDALTGMETTTVGDSASGMQGGSTPYLSYANIAKDAMLGQGDAITGDSTGDAALRAVAAYYTGGLSELVYPFF